MNARRFRHLRILVNDRRARFRRTAYRGLEKNTNPHAHHWKNRRGKR